MAQHCRQCWNNVATIWINVATMLQRCTCAKNRCCKSSDVTSPWHALTTSVLTCCLYLLAQSRSSRIRVSPSNIPNTAMRQAMNQTRGKFQKTCRKPRGRTQQIFIRGGYAPRSNPLPFYIPFVTKKVPLSYAFYWQMVPLSHTFLTAPNSLSFK